MNTALTPLTAATAADQQAAAAAAWQRGDAAALAACCASLPAAQLQQWPALARWRGLLGLLREDEEALACLELAHAGHCALGQATEAHIDACIALALSLCDIGAMESVGTWLQRADAANDTPPVDADPWVLWWHLGVVARAVLQPPAAGQPRGDRASLAWLHRLWQPLAPPRPAHEQLLVASVLVNAQFSHQQYEQFDLLAGSVGTAGVLGAVADLPAARWLYTLGFAYYQVGRFDAAQLAWQAGLQRAGMAPPRSAATSTAMPPPAHPHIGMLLGLAHLRLLLDWGRLADAQRQQAALATAWGPGRPSQRVELAQMRARLCLMQGQATAADAALAEALALARQAGFSAAELASCHTDLAQIQLALSRDDEALALLQQQAQTLAGRDAAVFKCLALLVQALQAEAGAAPSADGGLKPMRSTATTPAAATETATPLAAGLALAAQLRYTMFFRLLPAFAARVCALALQAGVEPGFVADVVRQRALPAPPGADVHWPWPLWLRLLGGFELRLHGQTQPRQPKPQAKPLELLRLLACSPRIGLGMAQAADALWPDADGAAAQKSLEVTVHRLRKLLDGAQGQPGAQLLTQSEGHLQLDVQRVSSDLRLRDGLTQQLVDLALAPRPGAGGLQAVGACLRQWLALATPDALLLPGAPETPWLLERRQQVQRDSRRTHSAVQALLARARAAGPADTVGGDALAAAVAALEATVAQVFAAGPQ